MALEGIAAPVTSTNRSRILKALLAGVSLVIALAILYSAVWRPRSEDAHVEAAASILGDAFGQGPPPRRGYQVAELLLDERFQSLGLLLDTENCGEGFSFKGTCFYYNARGSGFTLYRGKGFDDVDCFHWPERVWCRHTCSCADLATSSAVER